MSVLLDPLYEECRSMQRPNGCAGAAEPVGVSIMCVCGEGRALESLDPLWRDPWGA